MIKSALIFNLGLFIWFNNINLEKIRKDFNRAAYDKELCEKMIKGLENNIESNGHLAYLGALQAVWAKHTLFPLDKLNSFKKGKMNIENAIDKEKDNIEIRFIRLSIQKHSPEFLKYRSNIEEDEIFLKNNLEKVNSPQLKSMIKNVLEK